MRKLFVKIVGKLPDWLNSGVSMFIYLFLFFYLVVFALFTIFIPELSSLKPSSDMQLIWGNYTNVLSALGASIAAGSGVTVHKNLKRLHEKHDATDASTEELRKTIEKMYQKIEHLEKMQSKYLKEQEQPDKDKDI